jgi:hypothetical protein
VSAGGIDPTPPDPGAAPLDVAAIRAEATEDAAVLTRRKFPKRDVAKEETAMIPLRCGFVSGLIEGREYVAALCDEVERLGADVALQGDALMRWREMTGSDTPHAARGAIERERKVSAAWRALAQAYRLSSLADHEAIHAAAEEMRDEALADLRALSIDPEAP